jgi:hypothetical protein
MSKRVALEQFRGRAHDAIERTQVNLKRTVDHIYENLRTITVLPSVRRIDWYGESIDADARASIQEIYSNLAAEGVETIEQLVCLRAEGCSEVQCLNQKFAF